jgi:drug/metabolite transporter, DME family
MGRTQLSLTQSRLYVALAAVLWSTSGAFTKVLTRDTPLRLNDPPVETLQIAFYRVLFAGLFFTVLLRRADFSFRPAMLAMVTCFAAMNVMFVSAMALGTAANAILLQYTAPLWVVLASVCWLGERADWRGLASSAIGLAGILIIVLDGWHSAQLGVVALGLGSGITYAGVLIFLRSLRDTSPRWLTTLNHLSAALVLLPWVLQSPLPSAGQLLVLVIFGVFQMGIPYWFMARGLQGVSAQEAGTITLLEPLLNPVWAYLISGEEPSRWTLVGGAFILGALAWRYWPRRNGTADARR